MFVSIYKWCKNAVFRSTRKQFSGPREAIRQARNLTFYLVNKTLGMSKTVVFSRFYTFRCRHFTKTG
jgi:hypothetical protein|eukprot:COSAG06_NODE_2912_length_6101_cov_280.856215_3_plen_67_part_00